MRASDALSRARKYLTRCSDDQLRVYICLALRDAWRAEGWPFIPYSLTAWYRAQRKVMAKLQADGMRRSTLYEYYQQYGGVNSILSPDYVFFRDAWLKSLIRKLQMEGD